MFLSHLNFVNTHTLYSPEDVIDKAPDVKPLDKDGILDILNDESEKGEIIPLEDADRDDSDKSDKSDKKDKKDDKSDKENKDENEEDKDLKELEEDLEEPDEDKLELVTPVRRREILNKYPNVFKDFPYLEKAYYREQQFTEYFPTIEDAKQASEATKILTNFEAEISQGNTEKLLLGLKEENPKGFNKLVDNYLGTLLKTDKDAYTHVVGNLTKNTVRGMIQTARSENNEALEIAANLLYKWAFNTSKWEEPANLSNDADDKTDSKLDEVKNERQKLVNERFETANTELTEKLNNSLKSTIDAYIDPKDSMSAYVKKHATNECLDTLNSLIEKDSRFKSIIDRLWEKAMESNFSKDSLDTITKAFKSKARILLPTVIKQARKEALKGSSSVNKTNKDNDDNNDDSNDNGKNRSTNKSNANAPRLKSGNVNGPKPGQSTADYFLED
jgi:hypothetical protein